MRRVLVALALAAGLIVYGIAAGFGLLFIGAAP